MRASKLYHHACQNPDFVFWKAISSNLMSSTNAFYHKVR